MLSGGLGSSPYVKEQLKNRCEGDIADAFPCAKDMKFLTVQNPYVIVKANDARFLRLTLATVRPQSSSAL